jgi:hypothetical protein
MRRLLPLLFLCAFAPAVLAESVDLRAVLYMPPTAVYNADPQYAGPNSLLGTVTVNGTLTIINASSVPTERVTFDVDGLEVVGVVNPDPSEWDAQNVTCSGTRCTVLMLPPGSLTVNVSAHWWSVAAPGTVETTSATVSSTYSSDPDLTNNTAKANTIILWQSNLTFDALNVPSSVAAGQSCAIAAYCSNHGPSRATDMTLTISIPPGAKYEGFVAPPWYVCAEPAVGGHGDLVCTGSDIGLTDDVVQALVSVDPSLAPGTVLTMDGRLTSTSAVQSPLTASGSLTVTAPTPADAALSVTATIDNPSVVVGGWATETYTIYNAGPHDAQDVTLDVRLPEDNLDVFVPKLAGWTFDSCSGMWPIHCTAATLAPGATLTLLVKVPENIAGRFTTTAVASWWKGGPIAASNALVVTSGKPSRRRAARH